MSAVDKPLFSVVYNGVDITNAMLDKGFISLRYTDRYEFESDDLEIQVEDNDGLWQSGWYPEKGAKLSMSFGYGAMLVPAGEFEIDEIGLSGPPDVVTIRAIATGITQQLRTKRSEGYEKQNLQQIIQKVAGRNGLTVDGKIEQIQFERVTQNNETDVEFLKRLSYDFGYIFSIRAKKLVFYNIMEIDKQAPAKVYSRSQLSRWNMTDKSAEVFKQAEARHFDQNKKVTHFSVEQGTGIVKADTLAITGRTENKQQADVKAKVALYRKNSAQQEGSVGMPGDPVMVAGNVVALLGFGKFSGNWVIRESSHTFTRGGGYGTSLDMKRAGNTDAQAEPSNKESQNYAVYQS